MNKLKVEELTGPAFEKFGRVLGPGELGDPKISNEWCKAWIGISDLMGLGSVPGKQVTYLRIHARPKTCDQMEMHETSAEGLIPLEGESVLMVVPAEATGARRQTPDMKRARAFHLDGSRGVLMRPGTWHAVPWEITDVATLLVLVDDTLIEKQDLHLTPIEPVTFDLSGIRSG